MPKRLQYKRGQRLPSDAKYVGRPTKWGNPYKIGEPFLGGPGVITRELAVTLYAMTVKADDDPQAIQAREDARRELGGKDLACWCPLTYLDGSPYPCHATRLLEIAND